MNKAICLLLLGFLALQVPMAPSSAAQRSAADQALWEKALKACNSPQYSSGARPVVNYTKRTFKCVEPGSTRH